MSEIRWSEGVPTSFPVMGTIRILENTETQGEKLPSSSTDDTTPAINQPEAASDVPESPVDDRKLSRQEKWRRKNKVRVAAYMKGWRANRKAERAS